jgi:pimeloyl-ACP methyl ester carboxylesterase
VSLPTQHLSVNGAQVRVHYRPGTPTILFLHGYPDTLHVFGSVIERLPAEYGVVAADFPGQGQSEAAGMHSPQARAYWLVRLLDALEVNTVRVFGHDMGGQVALEFALLHRAESVVVSHTLLANEAPQSKAIRLMRASSLYRLLIPMFPQLVVSRCLATFVQHEVERQVEADIRQAFGRTTGETVKVCDAAETWLRRGLAPFSAISVPMTAIWSSRAPHFELPHAHALKAVLTKLRVVTVEEPSHWLCCDLPEVVVNVLNLPTDLE